MNVVSESNRRELLRYVCAGLTAVFTDLITYNLLLRPVGPSAAKAISFCAATVVAYILQKFWTFKQKSHSWSEMGKFAVLYSSSLCLNVTVNKVILLSLYDLKWVPILVPVSFQLGWLCATGASTIYNYVGQKLWVFKKPRTQPAPGTPE